MVFVCNRPRISLLECLPVSNKLPFEMALGTTRFGAWAGFGARAAVVVVTLLGAVVLSSLVVVMMSLLW